MFFSVLSTVRTRGARAQVLMAQELTEKAGQLLQKHVEEGMGARGEELVALHLEKLKEAPRRVAVSCTA